MDQFPLASRSSVRLPWTLKTRDPRGSHFRAPRTSCPACHLSKVTEPTVGGCEIQKSHHANDSMVEPVVGWYLGWGIILPRFLGHEGPQIEGNIFAGSSSGTVSGGTRNLRPALKGSTCSTTRRWDTDTRPQTNPLSGCSWTKPNVALQGPKGLLQDDLWLQRFLHWALGNSASKSASRESRIACHFKVMK